MASDKPSFIPYRAGPFLTQLGVKLVSRADGRAHIWLEVEDWMKSLSGFVHGGILATAADVVAAHAIISTLGSPAPTLVTTELHTSFLEPVSRGAIQGFGEIVHRGRSLVRVRATLRSVERERGILEALATFMLLPTTAEASSPSE